LCFTLDLKSLVSIISCFTKRINPVQKSLKPPGIKITSPRQSLITLKNGLFKLADRHKNAFLKEKEAQSVRKNACHIE
jgi:hypothetical protein